MYYVVTVKSVRVFASLLTVLKVDAVGSGSERHLNYGKSEPMCFLFIREGGFLGHIQPSFSLCVPWADPVKP